MKKRKRSRLMKRKRSRHMTTKTTLKSIRLMRGKRPMKRKQGSK